ncbi:MAG: TonB-dependent receptor [Bacteroidota bacterium]
MKLTLFIFFTGILSVSATGYSQHMRLNISLQDASIQELIGEIEDQSEFNFFYKDDQLDDNIYVNIEADNMLVSEVLNDVFKGTRITYSVVDKVIVIRPKENVQDMEITGTVTTPDGESLPGVTVMIKDTQTGTITGSDGKYTVDAPDANAVLVFSFIGYITQEIAVGNQTEINVTMEPDVLGLEEVVVVGYGTMRKSDLSGASTTVSTEDYRDLPSANIYQSMQGKVAGVSIMRNSGAPGQDIKIRIRGANSMLGGNDPLIVVDGVALNINIKDINPNDIESMEILKDASSTAIYGSRGANGVIVINTKRGSSIQPKVEISTLYSINHVAKKYDLLSAADYASLINERDAAQTFSDAEISSFRTNGGTDWQDEVFQNGYTSINQVSVFGGDKKLTYYLSGNYTDEKGLVINNNRKKYSLRTNIETEFNDRLSLALNLVATKSNARNYDDRSGKKEGPIWSSLTWSPTEPVYNDDGTYNITDQYGSIEYNPFMVSTERVDDLFQSSILANTRINYKLFDNLTFSSVLGIEDFGSESASFTNHFVDPTTGSSRDYYNSLFWQTSNFLTYKNTFDVHRISVMAGFEQSAFTSKGFNASGSNLATETVGYDNLALNASQAISSHWSRWALRSYFGRVTYSLKDRYLLTATYRMDGSSKFNESNKYSAFPSFSAGWRISEEQFMKDLNAFDNLKLRGSWGITGNQAIRPYATMALLSPSVYSYGTNTAYTGYSPVGAPNVDLRWEETTQFDVGLDFTSFQGRLSGSFDYFNKQTDGLLQAVALPAYSGGGTIIQNIGEIENTGFEATLGLAIIQTNDINWTSNFTFSSIKNEVIAIGNEEMIFPGDNYAGGFVTSKLFVVQPGESLGSFYGYEFLGIWQADEATEAALYGNLPGDSKYLDRNNDNIIDASDQDVIGNALPDFVWGLNNSISYKSLELNIMIEGVHGRDVLNLGYAAAGIAVGDARSITLQEASNTWTDSNTNTIWPKITSSSNTDFINSSKWLQDGSYVKLRNIGLTYILSKGKTGIGDFRFTLSAQNLITLTKYKGFDPEVTATSNSDIDQGLDMGAYPTARSITFGITLGF